MLAYGMDFFVHEDYQVMGGYDNLHPPLLIPRILQADW